MRSKSGILSAAGTAACVVLCAGVLVAPLLAGGATPFGAMFVRLCALAVFVLGLFNRRLTSGLEGLANPVACLMLLALLGFLQAMPWPREAARLVSPAHVAVADQGAQSLQEPSAREVALSLNPPASRLVALDCLVFAGLAASVFWVGLRNRRRLWIALAVVSAAGVQIVLGLRPWLAGTVPRLRGTYVNPDHLCMLLEIAACVTCGAMFWALSTRRFRARPSDRIIGGLISGTILLLLLSAIAFTGSRAGLVAVLLGLGVQVASVRRATRWRSLAATALAALASAAFLAWIGIGLAFGRWTSTSWFELARGGRALVWWESLELFRRFPLLGTGLGTFEQAFPLVQPASFEGVRWAKAHNDFLELAVTGGLVGCVLAAIAVAMLARALVRKLGSAVRSGDRAALSTALGCLVAVAVHETVDFGLSLPANALVLTAVVAASLPESARPSG